MYEIYVFDEVKNFEPLVPASMVTLKHAQEDLIIKIL